MRGFPIDSVDKRPAERWTGEVARDVRSLVSFPNPVNDVAPRTVATGVVVMASAPMCSDVPVER